LLVVNSNYNPWETRHICFAGEGQPPKKRTGRKNKMNPNFGQEDYWRQIPGRFSANA
jgi:hypothetical protein